MVGTRCIFPAPSGGSASSSRTTPSSATCGSSTTSPSACKSAARARSALLAAGRVAGGGPRAELYHTPASPLVRASPGRANRLDCAVENGRVRLAGDGQALQAGSLAGALPPDGAAIAHVRPYDVAILGPGERGAAAPAVVRSSAIIGARHRVVVQKGRQTLEAEIERDRIDPSRLAPGAAVGIA